MLLEINDLWKKFRLRQQRPQSLSVALHHLWRRRRLPLDTDFWALQGVCLRLEQGESLGVIGVNGSGKSTLLKLITGTMRPTRGTVTVCGRKSGLIELGAGFHPDFSGRDNVFINGMILGMDKTQIRRKFDQIVSFAELEQFIDIPVKYYSSGMYARLGFAVATAVEPELLIVDEVLAVGDLAFQQKCMQRIREMQKRGTSVVLVSHGLADIRQLCGRTLWLDHGRQMALGPTPEVLDAYMTYLQLENKKEHCVHE